MPFDGLFGASLDNFIKYITNVLWTVQTLQIFGWILALQKSALKLTHCFEYLDFILKTL